MIRLMALEQEKSKKKLDFYKKHIPSQPPTSKAPSAYLHFLRPDNDSRFATQTLLVAFHPDTTQCYHSGTQVANIEFRNDGYFRK